MHYFMTGNINYIYDEKDAEEKAARNYPAFVKWVKEDGTFSVITLSFRGTHVNQKPAYLVEADHLFILGVDDFRRGDLPTIAYKERLRGYEAAKRAAMLDTALKTS